MKALLRGERTLTVTQVLGLVGLLCLLASSLGLTLAYRQQLKDLKATIYTRCLQRTQYDRANHESVAADADLYQQLLDIAKQAPKQTDPVLAALVTRQEQVIRLAQQRKAAAARAGVIGSCSTYR
jgi:hypothetical protein